MPSGALEVSDFDVDLADPHVQVGGCSRHALAVCLGHLQCTLVQPACLAGSARREPHVGEHDGAAQLVDEVAGRVQARHSLRERLQRARHVALSPTRRARGTRPHRPARDGRRGRPGRGRAGRVPPCPPHRLVPARARPGRWRWSPAASGAPRCRPTGESAPSGTAASARSASSSRASNRCEVAGDHQHVSVEDAEHRAAPDGVVGQFLQPAEQHRFLPVTADRRRGQLHQVRRAVEVPRGQGVPDRLLREVVALVPLAGALVQQRNQVRLLGEQVRPQHVGEQVVVAVPLPPIVQGHEEQVGALQGDEQLAAVVAAGDGVTERPGEPVENRRVQQEFANRVGLMPAAPPRRGSRRCTGRSRRTGR